MEADLLEEREIQGGMKKMQRTQLITKHGWKNGAGRLLEFAAAYEALEQRLNSALTD